MNREECISYEEQFCEARDCGECEYQAAFIEVLRELEDEFFDPETGDYTDETFYAEDVIWRIENFIKEKIEGNTSK
jgi:hypothetical protein